MKVELDRSKPHILAILFDTDPEYGRSVRDIIPVEGVDTNARRRLKRAIVRQHGEDAGGCDVLYEGYGQDRHELYRQDMTHTFRAPSEPYVVVIGDSEWPEDGAHKVVGPFLTKEAAEVYVDKIDDPKGPLVYVVPIEPIPNA